VIKIDFHIHTVKTPSDSDFTFDLNQLNEYIKIANLDALAITNHNVFNLNQYSQIASSVTAKIFPGIEIDLEGGHLLVIADGTDLDDFAFRCQQINELVPGKDESITLDQFERIFPKLNKYILIPHYDKHPSIPGHVIDKLSNFITAGEVNSPKKFVYCHKEATDLVPVYFSDCRIDKNLTKYSVRQTYLGCDEPDFSAIKNCLGDKRKVALSPDETNSLFQVFDDGQKISTGLNVILGERSSGKSFTLKKIYSEFENVKYIRQFSLIETDDERDESNFSKLLSEKNSLLTKEYLNEFKDVVEDVIEIDIDNNHRDISKYIETLVKFSTESAKHDSFSKAALYSDDEFQILPQKGLVDLINSTQNLIENIQYREVIEKHIPIINLKNLIIELMIEYGRNEMEAQKRRFLNEIVRDIKSKLRTKTAAPIIDDIDLYRITMDEIKVAKFNALVENIRRERTIMERNIRGYKIVAKTRKFSGAQELKDTSKKKLSFASAFASYEKPYDYLRELKGIGGLEEADYFKFFVKIEYLILNRDGFSVSGGERSEFNLLQEINDAQKYDMLLIDEPESSFDNLFLKREVNEIIKDISKIMPVLLVTHNATVGASINPDYLLYTKKELHDGKIKYRIYSGHPTSKELVAVDGYKLKNYDVLMGCLEAGQHAYNDRSRLYEDIKN
jgi:ABC-type dipeptide/oligopeptide/nickel transport system ATPase component